MNYQRHYNLLIEKHGSKSKPNGYSERHHIVPRCLGGSDDESNLIYLSAEAHYVAHQLLVKMNPNHYGIAYAAMLMVRLGRGNGRISNKYYAWLKSRFSVLISKQTSIQMIGNKHLLGYKHSEESKNKMRGKTPWNKGKKGQVHSDETKEKIRNIVKGRTHSEETKSKMKESSRKRWDKQWEQ